jgi:hypothetical protein
MVTRKDFYFLALQKSKRPMLLNIYKGEIIVHSASIKEKHAWLRKKEKGERKKEHVFLTVVKNLKFFHLFFTLN